MSFLGGMRQWPDGKKRNFSLFIAFCVTSLLVSGWGIFDRIHNRSSAPASDDSFAYLKETAKTFVNGFNAAKEQYFGATTTALLTSLLHGVGTSTVATTSTSTTLVSTTSASKKR